MIEYTQGNREQDLNESQDISEARPRWETLYEKYSDSVKNPSNLYLDTTD